MQFCGTSTLLDCFPVLLLYTLTIFWRQTLYIIRAKVAHFELLHLKNKTIPIIRKILNIGLRSTVMEHLIKYSAYCKAWNITELVHSFVQKTVLISLCPDGNKYLPDVQSLCFLCLCLHTMRKNNQQAFCCLYLSISSERDLSPLSFLSSVESIQ